MLCIVGGGGGRICGLPVTPIPYGNINSFATFENSRSGGGAGTCGSSIRPQNSRPSLLKLVEVSIDIARIRDHLLS